MELTFDNAVKFNGEDSWVGDLVQNLRARFNTMWTKVEESVVVHVSSSSTGGGALEGAAAATPGENNAAKVQLCVVDDDTAPGGQRVAVTIM